MARVQPIRSQDEIRRIEDKLLEIDTPKSIRIYCMFEIGIYLGMRIGDMITLRVGDLRGRDSFTFTPQKTSRRAGRENYRAKRLTVTIAPEIRKLIRFLYSESADDDFLFPSQKHGWDGQKTHISRQTAWNDMKQIQRMAGLRYCIGCHTLRKTFGYHIYQQRHDVAWLQTWYGHSSPAVTLIYIGIADDEKKAVTDHMPFKNRGRIDYTRVRGFKKKS